MNCPVSVVLPARNASATLADSLHSISAQTFSDFELLIVDDHSSDDTRQIAADYAAAEPRCRLLHNPSRGIAAALNHGLASAHGNLIARMDADDRMLPGRLERQHAFMTANPGIVVLGCRVASFPGISDGFREYLEWQNRCLEPADIAEEIFVESPFAHPSVMFRRDTVMAAGGYRHGDFPEDYELWLRLHEAGWPMHKLPEVLLQWRDSAGRLSRRSSRYRREAFDELRSVYLARDVRFVACAREFVIWGAGRRTRKRCERLLSKGFRPSAWIDIDPRKIGNRLDGVPVVAPDWLEDRAVFVLGYVANHGARDDIEGTLRAMGFARGRDYLMVG